MAAGILQNDRMLYVGEMPWHKLGYGFDEMVTPMQAYQTVMDWEIVQEPVVTSDGIVVSGHKINIRKDTKEPFGIVSDSYKVIQNKQVAEFIEYMTQDPNGPTIVTAGTLFNGHKIWFLVKLPEFIKITNNDYVFQYILVTTGHSAQDRFRVKQVNTRVVCANTLSMALGERGRGFSFKHIGDVDAKMEDAIKALGIVRENNMLMKDVIESMTKTYPSEVDKFELINALYPITEEGDFSSSKLKAHAKINYLWLNGKGNDEESIRGTYWTLYNAVTEYEDHYRGKTDTNAKLERGFINSIEGMSAGIKAQAFELIANKIR